MKRGNVFYSLFDILQLKVRVSAVFLLCHFAYSFFLVIRKIFVRMLLFMGDSIKMFFVCSFFLFLLLF